MTRLTRRFNFTDRERISKNRVHIEVDPEANGSCIVAINRLDVSDLAENYGADSENIEVFLEARRTATESWHRQSLGTLESFNNPTFPVKVTLNSFVGCTGISFRVKVVDSAGRLLADGDDLHAGTPLDSEKEELIQLVPADLGEELWALDWTDASGPRVLVNNRIANSSSLITKNPLTRGLVMPHIVRGVLTKCIDQDGLGEEWADRWVAFAQRLGLDLPDDESEQAEWVEAVARAFASEQHFATKADEFIDREFAE